MRPGKFSTTTTTTTIVTTSTLLVILWHARRRLSTSTGTPRFRLPCLDALVTKRRHSRGTELIFARLPHVARAPSFFRSVTFAGIQFQVSSVHPGIRSMRNPESLDVYTECRGAIRILVSFRVAL